MKNFTYLILLVIQSSFGQIKIGTYKTVSDLNFTPEITFFENNTFLFSNRNAISCFMWYEAKGNWKINHDKIILTDLVKAFNKDLTETIYVKRKTVYRIEKENLIFYDQSWENSKPAYFLANQICGNFIFKTEIKK